MKRAKRNVLLLVLMYAGVALLCLLKPSEEFSASERRKLTQIPKLSTDAFLSGKYAEQFEKYVTDQFPFREKLRSLKAIYSTELLGRQDRNGIYEKNGYLCAAEYPMNEDSLIRAAGIFRQIYDTHLQNTDTEVYFSVIPDKNYFLAENTHLKMDYAAFFDSIYGKTGFMKRIPIEDRLEITDYYRTDSHWKQEEITELAAFLIEEMQEDDSGMKENVIPKKEMSQSEYEITALERPFYGVYYGQAALPVKADKLQYCTNQILEKCAVYDYERGKEIPLYDMEKAAGRDMYELFAGGNSSLVTIQSPLAASEEELIVFGDSFCRSLVPLLTEHYRRITIYDIRYLSSAYMGNYLTFTNQDILFLYSTSVLNNSITLK